MTGAALRTYLWAAAASLLLTACGETVGRSMPPATGEFFAHHRSGPPIRHVVLIIQENRTFNNLFAGFPGAVTSLTGKELVKQGGRYIEKPIALRETPLENTHDVTHRYQAFLTAWQNGAMDGFNLIIGPRRTAPEGDTPYKYVDPNDIRPYRELAAHWGLADEMFQPQGSDSFTAHQDLIRGGTFISAEKSLIDPPSIGTAWGCDSPPGTRTTFINTGLHVEYDKGPFPCSNKFRAHVTTGYFTLRDLLDAKSLSWKYYTPFWKVRSASALWNAFDVIAPVRYGRQWKTNISSPQTNIFADISNGTLPAMSWVIPDAVDSDHPGFTRRDTGPSWVASVVNAIGESKYWNSTAVIVVWDDWGGFYDPVAPPEPRDNQGGPGFRVPMIVISPYVALGGKRTGYVSHTVYSFGSILRFIEDTLGLGRLGTTDSTCASIGDMFDLKQSPRAFEPVKAPYDKAYFLRRKPSGLPVDTE